MEPIGAAGQALFRQQHARGGGVPIAHQDGGSLRIDVEGDAGLVQGGADAVDVRGGEAAIERFQLGPAQIVAAEPHGGENGQPDNGERREPPAAERKQAAPKPLQLFQPDHREPRCDAENGRAIFGHEPCAGIAGAVAPAHERTATPERAWPSIVQPCGWRLLEQPQDVLARGVGNAERLDAELLLHLQSLQLGRLLVHVGIDQGADTRLDGIHQVGDERLLDVDA